MAKIYLKKLACLALDVHQLDMPSTIKLIMVMDFTYMRDDIGFINCPDFIPVSKSFSLHQIIQ